MKIAIFISGQQRQIKQTWKSILTLFESHEKHYFFHLWKNEKDPVSEEWLVKTLTPISYRVEEQKDFYPQVELLNRYTNKGTQSRFLFRLCSQYYSLSEGKNIITNPTQYDFILKIRPDLYFNKYLDYLLKEIKEDELLIAGMGGPVSKKQSVDKTLGDLIFLSSSTTFLTLCKVYDYLISPEMWHKNISHPLTSHKLLKEFVSKNNINFRHFPFHFILLNPNLFGSDFTTLMKEYKKFYKSSNTRNCLFKYNNPDKIKEYENM